MENNEELDKKIDLCKKFGAVQFQKLVFIVEKVKFKVLKKLVPNYLKYFDKHVDKMVAKKLPYAKSEEEKLAILYKAKIDKMQERREFYQEKNRNYHIHKDNPAQIIKYLENNKKIHQNGLIKDAIFGTIMIPGIVLGNELAIIIFILELISAGINFECINLQNYNICRLTKIKDRMVEREERKRKIDAEKYKDISKDIHEAVMEKDEIPSIDEILARADTPEKLEQLKQLIARVKSERNIPEKESTNGFQKTIK